MKNAMKKLTSLLLVALLLVGMIPFGASAVATDNEDVDLTGGGSQDPAQTPSMMNLDPQNNSGAATQSTEILFDLIINYADGKTETYRLSMPEGTTAYKVLCDKLTQPVADNLLTTYKYTHTPATVTAGQNMTFTFSEKPEVVIMDKITMKVSGTDFVKTKEFKCGDELTLNAALVTETFGLTIPNGHEITYFAVGNNVISGNYEVYGDATADDKAIVVHTALKGTAGNNGGTGSSNPTTAKYVSVILVPNKTEGFAENEYYNVPLVNGKITQSERNKIADMVAGKGFIAWKRQDNGTQASSLVDFDFKDLTTPINLLPVVGSSGNNSNNNSNNNAGNTSGTLTKGVTVTFYDVDGKTVLHAPTTDLDGKLTYAAVDYAGKLATNPDGYTFANKWKLNGTGDAIGINTIVNHMTFDAACFFTPVYNTVKSDIVTSTKNQNDIFLNIFVNKDFNNCKTVKLNDHWVISDNKITTYEILNYVVTDYYKASNTNLGLQCDGLYYSVGSFMYNWLLDNAAVKTDAIDNIDVKRANGTVTINVMVTNAVAKTSTSVASDNPKTGDTIYTAMTVMGLSAASLAAVMYVFNKKRHTV